MQLWILEKNCTIVSAQTNFKTNSVNATNSLSKVEIEN